MGESKVLKKVMSACDVQTLKKCLEENKGDYIQAFKSFGSLGERQTGRNEKQMGHGYPFNSGMSHEHPFNSGYTQPGGLVCFHCGETGHSKQWLLFNSCGESSHSKQRCYEIIDYLTDEIL